MTTEDETIDAILGAILLPFGVVMAFVIGPILKGLVLCKLWAWFIVPVFHLPGLSIVYAIGIGIVLNTFMPSSFPKSDDKKKSATAMSMELILKPMLVPAVSFTFGYVVHLFA